MHGLWTCRPLKGSLQTEKSSTKLVTASKAQQHYNLLTPDLAQPFRICRSRSQARRLEGEADVGAADGVDHQLEVWPGPYLLGQVLGLLKGVVHQGAEVLLSSGLDHEPGLEGVDLASALNGHISGVVIDVVELVLLKVVEGQVQ